MAIRLEESLLQMELINLALVLLFFSTTTALVDVPNNVVDNVIDMNAIVVEVNSDPTSTYKASTYGWNTIPKNILESLFGLKLSIKLKDIKPDSNDNQFYTGPGKKNSDEDGTMQNYSKAYDAREIYPHCRSIGLIRDQSNCGSCWAVSAASVFSDRLCIRSNGKYNFSLSGHYTMSCDKRNNGCQGGRLDSVWRFYQETGCVTGGEYQSKEGCQDYGLRQCGRFSKNNPCSGPTARTPKCMNTKCTNDWYKYKEEKTIIKAKEIYQIGNSRTKNNEKNIMHEISTNGPVQAGFVVQNNFVSYKSGIYRCKKSLTDSLGGHAVKIIGWGEENGMKYWIAANSWGEDWGEGGTFRIVKGENSCYIEGMNYAGIPDI